MAYRIKLTPYTPEVIKFKGRDTFRVRVVASDAEDMPNEIFGHQRTLVYRDNDGNETTQDEFCFVCSPYDLSIYPAGAPDDEQSPQFFRKDTVDILVPGVEIASEVIAEIEEQVEHLISLMNKLDELEAGTPVWIPEAP